jgi:3'-phosphoadenosine 5'-phosphosulfate sulfotransferase (PAPS reductase)/FAD synthetase
LDPVTRRSFQLWAGTQGYAERIGEAEAAVEEALHSFCRPYIAFSGGKDSSVMTHMVLRSSPEATVFHWDYGPYYIPRWLRDEFLNNARALGARNIRVETSGLYLKEKRDARNVIGRILIGKLGPQMRKEYDSCFLGLRAEEGVKRRVRTKNPYEDDLGITNIFPVRGLTWRDVWAYLVSRGLPYASIYDRYGPVIGWDKVRLVTFFDREFEHFGSPILDGVLMPEFKNPEK